MFVGWLSSNLPIISSLLWFFYFFVHDDMEKLEKTLLHKCINLSLVDLLCLRNPFAAISISKDSFCIWEIFFIMISISRVSFFLLFSYSDFWGNEQWDLKQQSRALGFGLFWRPFSNGIFRFFSSMSPFAYTSLQFLDFYSSSISFFYFLFIFILITK